MDYTYDELHRLVSEFISDPVLGERTITYTYDVLGNRLQRDDSGDGITTYEYDANDRLVSMTTGDETTDFTYDDNGSPLTRSNSEETITYDWINNGKNRLAGVTLDTAEGTTVIRYTYDELGNRVSSSVDGEETHYLVDRLLLLPEVLMEYDETGQPITDYVYGNGLIRSQDESRERSYHSDALGSTRFLTDENAQVSDTYTYDAYGRLLSQTGSSDTAYQFGGEQRDSLTGLDYLRARYYDPDLGRFISKDAFSGLLGDPMSQHDYQYAHFNPVNFSDPSGYQTIAELTVVQKIIGALGAANLAISAGYISYSGLTGKIQNFDDLVDLVDRWVAGFADVVSLGSSTKIREIYMPEVAARNHYSGFLWTAGQVMGGTVLAFGGTLLPELLTMELTTGSKWVFLFYEIAGAAQVGWQVGTTTRKEGLTWGSFFKLAPYVLAAIITRYGGGQFLTTARNYWQQLKKWAVVHGRAYWDDVLGGPWVADALGDLRRRADDFFRGGGGATPALEGVPSGGLVPPQVRPKPRKLPPRPRNLPSRSQYLWVGTDSRSRNGV